ncbi:MAG: permease prefix domain 1-containing protein [Actinobacteria bacterium]|nr:permease prefix domain 1-containing protein [Actinomycetota bacterium]
MSMRIKDFLEEVKSHLKLDPLTERQIIKELSTYFQDKIEELRGKGLSENDAIKAAIESFGRARNIAKLTYQAHSAGSITDALLAALPHFIVAGLFASHLWSNLGVLIGVLVVFVIVTLFGWWIGRPRWIYTWIGYSLSPTVIGTYLMLPVFRSTLSELLHQDMIAQKMWITLGVLLFFIFTAWVFIYTIIRVIKRDWILVTLMLVHLPVIAGWLLTLEQKGGLLNADLTTLQFANIPMSITLLVLGVTSASFIKLRSRAAKIGALMIIGPTALSLFVYASVGYPGMLKLLIVSVLMLIFLLTPALLDAGLTHFFRKRKAW